ncbi:hypothetical protein GCM10009785_20430 [Brooklawnia cerclae]|uniref:Uncharacterized protein with PQ loop repeat n=1 Tax=Brooklawnia cerclae TaxID=349934 RepID=A0ABX0SFP6_9ACTN|nr:hypothetical protein [Brooklawnia cerclae]NIH57215.1 uncharacterized protein with PQ loop repeat [Brooklawnia cerclae]
MSLVTVVGWLAAIIGAGYAMPQFLRIMRTRTSAGLSRPGWQMQCAVCLAWIGHGIIYAMPNQVVCNLVTSAASLGVIVMLAKDRHLSLVPVLAPVVVSALLLVGVDVVFGQVVFGVVIIVPSAFTLLAQLRDLVVSPDVRGVSPWFLVLAFLIQSLWLVWSLMVSDRAVTISAAGTMALLAANYGVWLVRHARSDSVGPADHGLAESPCGTTLTP